MSQLELFKSLLGNPPESDAVLQFYLDRASDIICDRRHSDVVEPKYLNTQVQMAIEGYNKRGAEGQVSHGESGISRGYEASDISPSLLNSITPMARTPFSIPRVII
jgi:hypothetical protein